MKVMKCEMCGSHELVKQDGMYVCQYCGTKYTVEEARKLLGTVKIDRTEETENYLILARRARDSNESINAEKYYGMVLHTDPNNWEAVFFQVYFRAMQSNIMNMAANARSVANNMDISIRLVSEIEKEFTRKATLNSVIDATNDMVVALIKTSLDFYKSKIRRSEHGAGKAYREILMAVYSIFEKLEEALKKYFSNETEKILLIQRNMMLVLASNKEYLRQDFKEKERRRLMEEIRKKNPSYKPPKVGRSGCYVATAVYGSYDCPEVWTLRRYRDNTLASTWYGRCFIYVYYAVSPTLVKLFGKTEWFKSLWKPMLDKMVIRLNEDGVSDTPYEDRRLVR